MFPCAASVHSRIGSGLTHSHPCTDEFLGYFCLHFLYGLGAAVIGGEPFAYMWQGLGFREDAKTHPRGRGCSPEKLQILVRHCTFAGGRNELGVFRQHAVGVARRGLDPGGLASGDLLVG